MPDDFANDDSTTGVAVLGGTVSGSIESDGDHDWFAVDFDRYYTYEIKIEWTDAWDHVFRPHVRLFDQNSDSVNTYAYGDLYGRVVRSRFQDVTGNRYYIDALAYHSREQGSYDLTITVVDDFSTNSESGYGQLNDFTRGPARRFGAIETVGDEDWFGGYFITGRTYELTLDAIGNNGINDALLSLVDADGNVIRQDDNGGTGNNSKIIYTHNRRSQNLFLVAKENSGGTGTYRVQVDTQDDYSADKSTTAFLDMTTGSGFKIQSVDNETTGDEDWIRVKAEAGKWYGIALKNGANSSYYRSMNLRIFNSNDELLNSSSPYPYSDFGSETGFYAPTNGNYYIALSHYYSGSTGDIDVRVQEVDGPKIRTEDYTSSRGSSISLYYSFRNRETYLNTAPITAYEIYMEGNSGKLLTNGNRRASNRKFLIQPSDIRNWSYQFSNDVNAPGDTLYIRSKQQGEWTNWTRSNMRAADKRESYNWGNRFYYRGITYHFASTAPDYAKAEDTVGFRNLNAAQRTAVTSILADIRNNTNATFARSKETTAKIVFGQANLGTKNYVAFPAKRWNSGSASPGDIYLNFKSKILQNPAPGTKGYLVLMRAIGTAMGLTVNPEHIQKNNQHNYYSVMSDKDSPAKIGVNASTYMLGDVQRLQSRYGVGATGKRILNMGPNRKMVVTAGSAYQEISAKDLKNNVTIRLTDRQMSFAGPESSPTHIVYTSGNTIANARGGRGNDILVGNFGNNRIMGGAGNDRLRGLQGSDFLLGGVGNDRYNWNLGDGHDEIVDTGGKDTLGVRSFFQLNHVSPDITFEKIGNHLRVNLDLNHTEHRTEGSVLIKNMNLANRRVETLQLFNASSKVDPDISLVSAWTALTSNGQDNEKVRLAFASGNDTYGRNMRLL